MRPLTDKVPKPLLKIAGKTLIEYHIEALAQAGIRQIVINHAWLGQQIEALLGDGAQYGVDIVYSAEPPNALETAGGIIQALPLLGVSPFIVVNADIWTDYHFTGLALPQGMLAHLVLVDNPEQHPNGDFYFHQGMLVNQAENKLTYSGIGIYDPALFAGLEKGRRPLAPLLRKTIGNAKISAEHYQGQWFDIGTPERLDALDNKLGKR